jgi:crotonobetainyl-CoA:carnitine CoA-transferase CaiB-like acyl-CoA transferase
VAILAALQARTRSGQGQRIDVSLLETCLALMPNLTAGYLMAGAIPERLGNGHPNAVPYNVFATCDGHVTVAVGNDGQWVRLCTVMGHAELAGDERYAKNQARIERRAEVEALVGAWLRERSADEVATLLESAEVPCGPINSIAAALGDRQIEALNTIKSMVHPTSGPLRVVGSPLHFFADQPGAYRPPPLLGEHTRVVLDEVLSLGDTEIAELQRQGAFGAAHGVPRAG